jgi:hypothetical protein
MLNARFHWAHLSLSVVTLDELDALLLEPVQKLVRPVERRGHGAGLRRVQDVGLRHTPEAIILDWAPQQARVVVSVDNKTLPVDP